MEGALRRYVQDFGQTLAYGDMRHQGRVLRIVGFCLAPIGLAAIAAGLVTGSEIGYGGIGPAIAGLIQIGMGTAMSRRSPALTVRRMSGEATRVFRAIGAETDPWKDWGSYRPDGSKRPKLRVTGAVREWLEASAAHALRIDGALATAAGRPSLDRRRDTLLAAVHSAMSEAFHHACIALDRPEASTTAIGRLIETESKLAEMADRIESMVRSASLEDRIAGHSPLDDALDSLRTEAAAERELA